MSSSITPKVAGQIVDEIHALDLPLTAKTYHVWFGHKMGWYPELSLELERILQRNGELTEAKFQELYAKHIVADRQSAALQEAETAARELFQSVLGDVQKSSGATSEYHEELQKLVGRLGTAASVVDVFGIVKALMTETSKMEAVSDHLRVHLEQATSDIDHLKQKLNQLEQANLTDPLTGLNNRKALGHHLATCFESLHANEAPFCVIMLDVDHFKSFNDTYGHDVGDAVLRSVSGTLNDTGHPSAIPHRYGGEEFCVIVVDTDLDDAIQLADDIRLRIADRQLRIARTSERINPINISAGVALATQNDSSDSLIQRADEALYLAKNAGRNNVKSERDLTSKSVTAKP